MVPATPLCDQARSIFSDLGYSISDEGSAFRARRDWKEVYVTPVEESVEASDCEGLRCYVTWKEQATATYRSLTHTNPDCEWALIGVSEDGEYEVAHAPGR